MTEEDTVEYYFIAAQSNETTNQFIVESIIWDTFSGYTHFSNPMDLNEQKKEPDYVFINRENIPTTCGYKLSHGCKKELFRNKNFMNKIQFALKYIEDNKLHYRVGTLRCKRSLLEAVL
jgi:hypothetical protein